MNDRFLFSGVPQRKLPALEILVPEMEGTSYSPPDRRSPPPKGFRWPSNASIGHHTDVFATCLTCQGTVDITNVDHHRNTCPKAKVSCPNPQKQVERYMLAAHQKDKFVIPKGFYPFPGSKPRNPKLMICGTCRNAVRPENARGHTKVCEQPGTSPGFARET